MKISNKIICSSGTTINKTNLKTNSKNNNLFVGIIYNKVNFKNEYLTILNFDLFNIESNGLIIKLEFVLLDKIDINIGVISTFIYLFIS